MQRMGFKGIFRVKMKGRNAFRMQGTGFGLENEVFWKGILNYEPFTIQTFAKQLNKADWFVDVGSNTGIFSLLAASMQAGMKVFAIEPMPVFYTILQQNISLNQFHISAFQLALSNQNGFIPLYFPRHLEGNIYAASLSLAHFKHHQNTAPNMIEVATSRFDDLIKDDELQGKGVIKIDAEGHGVEVLEGMQHTILEHRPAVIIEVASEKEARQVTGLLKGYSFFGINDQHGSLTKKLSIPFSKGCNNYLCLFCLHGAAD